MSIRDDITGRTQVGGAPPCRVTLHDVARHAGVSVSAVSKVIRDAYGVSEAMRMRVEESIAALGYRPHAAARSMRGRSYTLGVTVVDLASPFQGEVATGVRHELLAGPFQEVLMIAGATGAEQRRAVDALRDRGVDGIIMVSPWVEGAWIEEVAREIPVVTVAMHGAPQAFDAVVTDEEAGAGLVVDHLVSLGHRRIAHIGMSPAPTGEGFALSHTVRRHAYEAAMSRHGLEVDVVDSMYSERGGYEAARVLLSREERPTAIFAGADIAAFGVLGAAAELGVDVPGEVSLVGYDNVFATSIPQISLTTVDQSGEETGATAARLLRRRVERGGSGVSCRVITPSLLVRETSGPPVVA